MTEKLIYTPTEAAEMLGVGIKTFKTLGVAYVEIGKRKRYKLEDLKQFIIERTYRPCQLRKGRTRRITGTISPSEASGFEEAVKQTISKQQNPLQQNSAPKLYIINTSAESRV